MCRAALLTSIPLLLDRRDKAAPSIDDPQPAAKRSRNDDKPAEKVRAEYILCRAFFVVALTRCSALYA